MTPDGERLIPIPMGATYLVARRELAGHNDMNTLRLADRLLQTAECVGGLACCLGCEVRTAPCPVALEVRVKIVRKVLSKPIVDGPPNEQSVLLAVINEWSPPPA